MFLTSKKTYLALALLSIVTPPTPAAITLYKAEPQAGFYQRFGLAVGGSLRLDYANEMGPADNDSYKRRGYTKSSRLRFYGDFVINDRQQLIAYYEPRVDIAHVAHDHRHYSKDEKRFKTRRAYVGIRDACWGQLSYGRQDSAYYLSVGKKTAKPLNDKLAQQAGVSIDNEYTGTHKARELVNYIHTIDDTTLYITAQLPTGQLHKQAATYQRHWGGAIGIDQLVASNWTLSVAYNYINADIIYKGAKNLLDQHTLGASLAYKNGGWYAALGGGYYWNLAVAQQQTPEHFYYTGAYGIESFAGYKVSLNNPFLRSYRPYIALTRLQAKQGSNYYENNYIVGISLQLSHSFRLAIERTQAQRSHKTQGLNRVRLRYDF